MATIRERIKSAGVDPDTAEERLRQGWVRVDGEVVTDGDTNTDGRIVFVPAPVTEQTTRSAFRAP